MCLDKLKEILSSLEKFNAAEIESGMVNYICKSYNINPAKEDILQDYIEINSYEVVKILETYKCYDDISLIIKIFEKLLEKSNIDEDGIVFTPKYISDYISKIINYNNDIKIIDPGCGCGIFLISVIDYLKKNYNIAIKDTINNHIYGIDINEDNVRRCKIVLYLYSIMNKESISGIKPNIICSDSLANNWNLLFHTKNFDYIIGNPPYVNPHNMSKETSKLLRKTFTTTTKGTFNIFYAFIEQGMKHLKKTGKLSYIIPNNILTIKSAYDLRYYIQNNHYLESIINFTDNMIFKPVRTYNCIIVLSKQTNTDFLYSIIEHCDDIEIKINNLEFNKMHSSELDAHTWKLLDKQELKNLKNIEGQFFNIKDHIKTGIATLSDNIYMLDFDGKNFFKDIDGTRYVCENDLVRKIYKIPELKKSNDNYRYILFPYKMSAKNSISIIQEEKFIENYPNTYKYLLKQKSNLDKRDKGKVNNVSWYAYGRSQGLSNYGKKIMYPTFSDKPKFRIIEDKEALFCNGYAILENNFIDLDILVKILNSTVMEYYISKTSYPIEGNCYCYQKKYIERFSIPFFTPQEINNIRKMSKEELDIFLIEKYNIKLFSC